jgi:hypothetical protein
MHSVISLSVASASSSSSGAPQHASKRRTKLSCRHSRRYRPSL